MIEMVLVYCLVAHPEQCVEQRPVFEEPLNTMECMMNAQRVGVQYIEDHPEWLLSKWRCEIDVPQKRDI